MAHGSHVPKFGNWDGDDVPYTAYFENARKEKAGGAARMNPNDPEENPDAFRLFRGFVGTDDLPPAISVETTGLDQFTVVGHEKFHHHPLQINEARVHHQRNASDRQQKSSSPSSEKSNSSCSSSTVTPQQQLNHRHKTSGGRKSSQSSSSSSNGFATRPPSKGGRNPSEDLSSRSASVPKFGEWDERDPKSGEGFTVIFNKVKEEKQITAAKFPPVQPDTSKNRETQGNEPRQKIFCCLF